jgi:hypothetical protein
VTPHERTERVKVRNRVVDTAFERCAESAESAPGGTTQMRTSRVLLAIAVGMTAACGDARPDGAIDVVVILPESWPDPMYTSRPEVYAESSDGNTIRTLADGFRIELRLPASGMYSVGATAKTGGGACWDTAGVTDAGNPPVEVDDGDVLRLRATGDICE